MRELKFTKKDAQLGKTEIWMRIMERHIFFKFNNSQYANQMIAQLKNKGALVDMGKHLKWIKVDMFSPHLKTSKLFKLGDVKINFDKDTTSQIENKIVVFFTGQYGKAGFKIE